MASADNSNSLGQIHDLHKHAANGNTQNVQSILSSSSNSHEKEELLRLQGPMKNTALHLAVLYRHKDTAKALVEQGASLTAHNQYMDMPISFCTDAKMLQALLLSSNPTNNATNEQQQHSGPLDSHYNNLCRIRVEDIGKLDSARRCVLHYASLHLKQVEYTNLFSHLLSKASPHDLQLKDGDGATFVGVAAKEGNTTALEALKLNIDGIDADTQKALINGEAGITALMHGHRDFFDQLLALSKGIPAKVKITLNMVLSKLNEAVDKKIDDDATKHKEEGKVEPTKRLDSMKAQLKAIGDNSLPTYLALYAEKDEVFKFLLETGLLTKNQWDDKYKRTCVHWAVVHKRVDIVDKLLAKPHFRPSPSIKDAQGKTALQIAFEDNNQEAMELLKGKAAFKEYEDKLFRDREVYVQALNAVVVGAALIGSVTFAGWLQLPSSVEFEAVNMKVFWVCNSVSFYSAVASMCVSIASLLPTPTKYVGDIVNQVRVGLVFAALFVALSLAAVTMAFASAGFAAAPPAQNERDYYWKLMWSSTIPGACAGAITLLIFMIGLIQDVLFQDIRLFIKCIPYIKMLVDETEDITRSSYTNANLREYYQKDLVSLHDTSHDTIPSERRKELKNLGFHFKDTRPTLSFGVKEMHR